MAPHIDDSPIGNPSLISSSSTSQPAAAAAAGGSTHVPLAVVSMACRLPDECHTPNAFWKFMMEGKIAMNTPPATRFDLNTHYDGSLRAQTMASPGGMFLQKVDPRDLDAQFFRLSGIEASSMDPQQRQLLEVVYEGLENGGITLDQLSGSPVGCFVSSFASDYGDIQARDPENRSPATVIGVGRAMLSNRLSHFLNIKGPSMTIDTACSGALIGVDLAMRYLQSGEITSAIVAGANLYYSPEHVMDNYMGANGTASLSGKCHTFSANADGYIKAEAVNMVYLKRLDDAVRDGDPIRAIIRGSATNSDGWTPGIALPNPEAQAAAIRQAYKNAGISDLSQTSYVEFHGTGTRAGDSLEASGVADVFTPVQPPGKTLRIGSVKGNIGHGEPAAGLSGLIKTVLCLEKGVIPGNPTFVNPSPKIDFEKLKLFASRTATPWPDVPFRRASINSFGYGGSNAHVVMDDANALPAKFVSSYVNTDGDVDFFDDDEDEVAARPYLLAFSANDEKSCENQVTALDRHLSDPAVSVKLRDLAYTLGERRSRHYYRSFHISTDSSLDVHSLVKGHIIGEDAPRVGLVFTGQGAQWPEMGKALLATIPLAARTVRRLDEVLQRSADPPTWTLYDELSGPRSAEHMRNPELSQPLVTALQLALLSVFRAANVTYDAVVGHSSGEIAAAVAAGHLTQEQAIQIAYYRGKATSEAHFEEPVGMMAVGLDPEAAQRYIEGTSIQIACYNSPQSLTLSGTKAELADVEAKIKADGHFARLLLVDAAYHSKHMKQVADKYLVMVAQSVDWEASPPENSSNAATMFSSTTGKVISHGGLGPDYWVKNMISPVLFSQAANDMLKREKAPVDLIIELGPSNALFGPLTHIIKAASSQVTYIPALKRGPEALQVLLEAAGHLFLHGCPIRLSAFNEDDEPGPPVFITDLPNYSWNHSTKYWHEGEASIDWRFRKFLYHDLLGSKILGTPWERPIWKNVLRIDELSWIKDHTLGASVIFPAAGYVAMATEAIYQKTKATGKLPESTTVNQVTYKFRNVTFPRMLTLDNGPSTKILLSLEPCSSSKESWHEFVITSIVKDGSGACEEHCRGLIMIGDHARRLPTEAEIGPLKHPSSSSVWYKAMQDVGYKFGPAFRTCLQVEAALESRECRALIKLDTPASKYAQSQYSMHPTVIDGCLQIATVALCKGHHSDINTLLPPVMIDDLVIFPQDPANTRGIVGSEAKWTGVGRPDDSKRFVSDIRTFAEESGDMIFHLRGLRYHAINAVSEKPHTYTQLIWSQDIDFLTKEQLSRVLQEASANEEKEGENVVSARIAKLASLITHKRPDTQILEVALDEELSDGSCLWIDSLRQRAGQVAAGAKFRFSAPTANASLAAREKYHSEGSAIEHAVHGDGLGWGEESADKFDLVILRASRHSAALPEVLGAAQNALTANGYLVLVRESGAEQDGTNGATAANGLAERTGLELIPDVKSDGVRDLLLIGKSPSQDSASTLPTPSMDKIHLVRFDAGKGTVEAPKKYLTERGFNIEEQVVPTHVVPEKATVLVLDEINEPVVANLGDDQFHALREFMDKECRILWVTKGSQMKVTNPELGLMFGASRTLLGEYPSVQLLVLDITSADSELSFQAIHRALNHLSTAENLAREENEFVEREGMFHISRIVGDEAVNAFEREMEEGAPVREEAIGKLSSTVRLTSDRIGTLDTLIYSEISDMPALGDDEVEIDVKAAGMNFKDLANAMGFVPANEHLFGLECVGVVREVGKDVVNVAPGDRVLMIKQDGGCFANRVRNTHKVAQKLPDNISFLEGATLGIAHYTALYGLVTMANVQAGQSVLIHSAAGGVGLAAIDLCHDLGAEIYVTVGTDAKRDFLAENYGIPRNRMFSSRSTAFAAELMEATGGRGVDVCLNSLTGDLLHESWRCIAENGTLVEIGKKDILDRSSLSMEPFGRNCSYRALDLSRKGISYEIARKGAEHVLRLVREGRLRPLHTCKVFPYEETAEAFAHLQRGQHIGKVVISYENCDTVKVPYRPAAPDLRLRGDGSYMIVGGFKGLCGSLAVYLARRGAGNIVVISRSGFEDERSQKVIYDCETLGCHVDLVEGDINILDDIRRAFKASSKPVLGIIQGAMVLTDKTLSNMTPEEFRRPIAPKYEGTWNLHNVSLEQDTPLDFFTLLSSVSGLVGQLGQSNYAAANSFQDSFAWYRLQQGLPACAINLGPIEDVGYLGDKETLNRFFAARGWLTINEALLYRILRMSIMQQQQPINAATAGQLVTAIMPGNPPFEAFHRFSTLRAPVGGSSGSGSGRAVEGDGSSNAANKLAMLKKAATGGVDHATLLAAAVEVVNPVLMRSLAVSEKLDPARPLANYGVDSLIAVEMRNWVRGELGVEMSSLEVVGARTLTMLCEAILSKLMN